MAAEGGEGPADPLYLIFNCGEALPLTMSGLRAEACRGWQLVLDTTRLPDHPADTVPEVIPENSVLVMIPAGSGA